MGLLDDLSQPPAKQWSCRVRTLSNEFDKKDKEIFDKAILDPNWPAATLSAALAKKGISIAGSIITRHRKGECSC